MIEVFVESIQCQLTNKRLVRITDNIADIRKSCEFFRSALGIAAGDDNLRTRVARSNAPDGLADIAVGFGSDGAGVHDDNARGIRGCRLDRIRVEQFLVNRCALGLRCPAAEVRYMKCLIHGNSHTPARASARSEGETL